MPSEPTTPTGKEQHGIAWSDYPDPAIGGGMGHNGEPCRDCDIIATIEAEARQQERALADELADALDLMHGVAHRGLCPESCQQRAALKKWEASKT